jgi:hypothetical protein
MTYQKQWVERADNVPGYIYFPSFDTTVQAIHS